MFVNFLGKKIKAKSKEDDVSILSFLKLHAF